jgi:phosphoglucomutase
MKNTKFCCIDVLEEKKSAGVISEDAFNNVKVWYQLGEKFPKRFKLGIEELIQKELWEDLNNRFFKNISFGTGGIRGRSIENNILKEEYVTSNETKLPKYPAIGSNCFNEIVVIRTTMGLFSYIQKSKKKSFKENKKVINNNKTPLLIVAYDTRWFSKYFSRIITKTWINLGGKVYLFKGPRPTPQLSFTVKNIKADSGIIVTASHNPFFYNGYKVYLKDGGQISSYELKNLLNEISKINLSFIKPSILKKHKKDLKSDYSYISYKVEKEYVKNVKKAIIDYKLIKNNSEKIVFTSIHGTSKIHIPKLLKDIGYRFYQVPSQKKFDPLFSTVSVPNPEILSSFKEGIKIAKKFDIKYIISSDPDGDRIGLVVANKKNKFKLIPGGLLGSLLAEYRINKMKELNWIPKDGTKKSVLIKTFVTSPMQEKIAKKHGIRIVNTLTGFRWIAEKIKDYENLLNKKMENCNNFDLINSNQRRISKIYQKYSNYCILGSEESCGYLSGVSIRDKDAHGSTLMICELLSFLKSKKIKFFDYINKFYLKYGFFKEKQFIINCPGESGFKMINKLIKFYNEEKLPNFSNFSKVEKFYNFNNKNFIDSDRKIIQKDNFFIIRFKNNYSYAFRPSGTEPKLKFYIFANEIVLNKKDLKEKKRLSKHKINKIKEIIKHDLLKKFPFSFKEIL